ncbi:MAG: MoaD/ThiS family protein [Planctomycetota bacterium]|jgi:sulfur carrier protein
MMVEVRLFASFREGRFKEKELELPEGSSLGDLLAQLEIAQKDAKITIVNGSAVSAEQELAEKDVIAIFPPIAGG